MSQLLPTGNSPEEINDLDVTNVPDDDPTGYILEVDLEYHRVSTNTTIIIH